MLLVLPLLYHARLRRHSTAKLFVGEAGEGERGYPRVPNLTLQKWKAARRAAKKFDWAVASGARPATRRVRARALQKLLGLRAEHKEGQCLQELRWQRDLEQA